MYYEEKWIDGTLHGRNSPTGEWTVLCHAALNRRLAETEAERARLDGLVNHAHTAEFLEATRLEVAHQVERWGTVHDRAKAPADWFWLLGYLSGKALAAHAAGDVDKALHHTISSAAVLANWHAAISLQDNRFSPGASDLQSFLAQTFGEALPT